MAIVKVAFRIVNDRLIFLVFRIRCSFPCQSFRFFILGLRVFPSEFIIDKPFLFIFFFFQNFLLFYDSYPDLNIL